MVATISSAVASSGAAVGVRSAICCTSSSAVKILGSVPATSIVIPSAVLVVLSPKPLSVSAPVTGLS